MFFASHFLQSEWGRARTIPGKGVAVQLRRRPESAPPVLADNQAADISSRPASRRPGHLSALLAAMALGLAKSPVRSEVASAGDYPLTPPAVRPPTRCFCRAKKRAMTGIETRMAAAAKWPHSVL